MSQAEAGRNYKLCEQITEELMALKNKRRDLEAEKHLFEHKAKRAKRRMQLQKSSSGSTSTDAPSTSRMSVTPGCSQLSSPSCTSVSIFTPLRTLGSAHPTSPTSSSYPDSPLSSTGTESHSDFYPLSPAPCESVLPESSSTDDTDSHF